MNDDELGQYLGRSIERRVQTVTPRVDLEELLVRTQRRLARQRRVLVAAVVAVLVIGGLAGYLVASGVGGDDGSVTNVALDDGAPGFASAAPGFQPANVDVAKADIARAFHAAFDGNVAGPQKTDAIQDGAAVESLKAESKLTAMRFGYTPEQLAGTTTSVLGSRFIDSTHAIVQFSITIPGHGEILKDRVGYAVLVDGRWKVALRTFCDLLSLDGLGRPCPPAPTSPAG